MTGLAAAISRSWVIGGMPENARLIGILLLNLAVSALFAFAIQLLPRKRRSGHRVLNVMALAALGAMLPVLGPLLILVTGLAYPLLERDPRRRLPTLLKRPEFAEEVKIRSGQFGHGGALAQLRSPSGDSRQATRALIAIETRRDQETTRLLYEALSHPDETLRLIAHNFLGRREKVVIERMTRLENIIESTGSATARLAVDLAELHLEFLYLGIVDGALRTLHLRTAERLLAGLDEPDPPPPWASRLLILRARLKQMSGTPSENSDITQDYEHALELGAAPARALPWLLERAWRERNYPEIQALITKYPLYVGIPVIGPVIQRWNRHDDA